MGKKGRFKGARHAPKRLEEDIMAMSKALSDNPWLLRPKCAGNCKKCHFDKTFLKIEGLEKFKGSAEALNKIAQRGSDDIVKAYAGTVSVYASGHVPCLASAKLAGEDVPYVMRGRVGNDKLVGIQYYDDPKKRLLLYNSFAKKKKLYIYSLNDELVCSNSPNMPKDYLLDLFFETPYEFDDDIRCGHVSEGTLVIRVKSMKEEIRICSDCATDVSTLQYLISRIIAIDPLGDIEVSVEHRYHASKDGDVDRITTDEILEQYSVGKITDRGIVDLVLRSKRKELASGSASAYIIDKKHYGDDLDTFISDLRGIDVEKDLLKKYLKKNKKAVILRSDRIAEALGYVWKDGARDILVTASSEEVVDKIDDLSKLIPSEAIECAIVSQMSLSVASKVPEIRNPGPMGRLADGFARSVKAGGTALLKKDVVNASLKESRSKSLAKAFILSAGIEDEVAFKCSNEEEDLARFLRPFVDKLISSEGKDYIDAMENLLTASGSGERL